MAIVDETWPGVVEVGDVARHLPRRRFGCGVCVVVVDLGDVGPSIVVVVVVMDNLGDMAASSTSWKWGVRGHRCW